MRLSSSLVSILPLLAISVAFPDYTKLLFDSEPLSLLQYAERLYSTQECGNGQDLKSGVEEGEEEGGLVQDAEIDIAADIKKEIQVMKKPTTQPLFLPVRIDIKCGMLLMIIDLLGLCIVGHLVSWAFSLSISILSLVLTNTSTLIVLFFKTRSPLEPVSFVHKICHDAAEATGKKNSRWIKRLSPMTMMGKATEKGLEEVSAVVLAPHFHLEGGEAKKVGEFPSLSSP